MHVSINDRGQRGVVRASLVQYNRLFCGDAVIHGLDFTCGDGKHL